MESIRSRATRLSSASAVTNALGTHGRDSLRGFLVLLHANLFMYIRNKGAMFWVVVFPVGLMLIFGAMYGSQKINPADPNSLTAISFIAPGLIVLSLMSNGLVGNAGAMAGFRERGILRRIQATPLPVWHLLLARVLTQSLIMLGQAALMLGISVLVFGARYDGLGLVEAIPGIVAGMVLFLAMGQAIAALVRKQETVGLASQVLNFILMFLGGLWSPVSAMPEWLQSVSKWLPSTMVADLVRTPMLATYHLSPTVPLGLAALGVAAYFLASLVISARFFKWS